MKPNRNGMSLQIHQPAERPQAGGADVNRPARPRSAHLIGARGAGMKALSELLLGLGWHVTGSDQQSQSTLERNVGGRQLRIHQGHQLSHLPDSTEVVVYSSAVPADNSERQRAAELGIPQFSYTEMLGELMKTRSGVCIAGTHGKSTTTAMVATILTQAGFNPSCVIGAELLNPPLSSQQRSGWAGAGELLVVESCEYQRNFLSFYPRYAVILGIEPDHFDCFPNVGDLQGAFQEFALQVQSTGHLLINGSCPVCLSLTNSLTVPVSTFSLQPGTDWWAGDSRATEQGVRFRVFRQDTFFGELQLAVPGQHNVLNALAATALCHEIGVPTRQIKESLAEFCGIRRRFESIGFWRGITLIDDYAHHPTAIRTTLRTAREKFGKRRIWCAFQPHQVSRTQALFNDFADSFGDADEVMLVPVFAAREQAGDAPARLAEELADRINSQPSPRRCRARYSPALDLLLRTLEDEARPGDVLITMGAGDINWVHHELSRQLHRHHAAR